MFSTENLEGFSQVEVDALNVQLAERLDRINPNDVEGRIAEEKAFREETLRHKAPVTEDENKSIPTA